MRKSLPFRTLISSLAVSCAFVTPVKAFGLDFIEGYRLAIENDPRHLAARADAAGAREITEQAWAQLLPNISANAYKAKSSTDSEIPGPFGDTVEQKKKYDTSTYGINLRQPIFRKYNFARYEQAKFEEIAAEATLNKNLQDVLVRYAGAYFDALIAEENLTLVVGAKETYASQLEAAKRGFSVGQGTRTDIDDAQARYDMALAQELEAQLNVAYSRQLLESIINRPVSELVGLDKDRMTLEVPAPQSLEAWMAQAEDRNPDLRTARANVEAASLELDKAQAGHFPTLDLVAQRTRSENASDTTINQRHLTTQYGFQLNIPLYAGGGVSSQERQAASFIEKNRQTYEATRRDVALQVRKEYQNIAAGIVRIKALEQAERSAEQAFFSSQKGLQAGTRSSLDILNAQQQRLNASRDLAQARYAFIISRIRLHGLVNGIDEAEIFRINGWLADKRS